ncbi:IclR family transcriptional regulator [Lysinibacillus yapensis]|uniref:IclR family transcriptional regulator n=1 Tax=Ureibacillus yapensis TaxID=2304605 RepID=A0A396SBJ0_9BACL|nr:IclR family transcriptional regulator [Lysinibacillus yapensis]RHW38738.1 IclR family transcriptional regulator [Lysinibacillus yapensis]
MTTNHKNNTYTMQSLTKAIHVLKAFTRKDKTLSLTQLHNKTGIGISSLQRIVATLINEGFLHKDEKTKTYELGLSIFILGNLVEQESGLITVAKPILANLNHETGESISLNIIDGDERRCLLNLESTHSLSTKAYVGDSAPLFAGASAKTLLAFLSHEEIEQYLNKVRLVRITPKTITNKQSVLESLAEIREKGYAISKSERILGVASISAPILLPTGKPLASITIVIPEVRFSQYNLEELIQKIKEAAHRIEQQLY